LREQIAPEKEGILQLGFNLPREFEGNPAPQRKLHPVFSDDFSDLTTKKVIRMAAQVNNIAERLSQACRDRLLSVQLGDSRRSLDCHLFLA
jgi:hypothetical protein